MSGAINVTLSALIILRLYSHKKSTQITLGMYQGQLYTRIMVMLTESCAIIVLFTALYIALFFTPKPNGKEVPLFLLPQICVSPLCFYITCLMTNAYDGNRLFHHSSLCIALLDEGHPQKAIRMTAGLLPRVWVLASHFQRLLRPSKIIIKAISGTMTGLGETIPKRNNTYISPTSLCGLLFGY